ncbi:arginine deiminase family protein [Curtobacterium flaccumfaciens]|nr:arginine deiminase family protein [Curtobacterium flaccumfaciens]
MPSSHSSGSSPASSRSRRHHAQRHDVRRPERVGTAGVRAFSEVGRLRKVLVCEPGLAHRRLTPSNNDALLFDDVLWVENAQEDHRAFVASMRSRDVEVLELHEVLAETLAVPGARDWLLQRKVTPNEVGPLLVDATLDHLAGYGERELAEVLIGGLNIEDLDPASARTCSGCTGRPRPRTT